MVQLYRRRSDDMLVNTETAGTQQRANLSVLQNGGYVVVWNSGSAVKGQRFEANGDKVGSEFLVNTAAGTEPEVATLPSGRFVVTWTVSSPGPGDFSETAIRGQLFEADGSTVGSEFQVNTQTNGRQVDSAVTELAGGGFVVSWTDSSGVGGDSSSTAIKAQLFDGSAVKVGGEILVNTATVGQQTTPSLIALPSGGFAVVWIDAGNGGNVASTRLQLFDSAGAKVGGEQAVSGTGRVQDPNIAALDSGFLVTWAEHDGDVGPSINYDVKGQRYDSTGAKLGGEFLVNTQTVGSHSEPDAHALPGGGFIVTWHARGEGLTFTNVYGQIFDSAGNKLGPDFIINTVTQSNQLWPEVEVLPSGDIVVVWTDLSGTGGDSSAAIRSQILTVSTQPADDIDLSMTTISETAREGTGLVVLTTDGALNSSPTYSIVSDSTGGAFGVDGDRLVVVDNSLLDFETDNQVEVRIRTTDENGVFFEETIQLDIADTPESGYSAVGSEFLVNTTTQDNQTQPVITPLASGGYVAIWEQWPLAGGATVGKAQIYNAAGDPVGGELSIRGEAATALPGGGFVTTWTEQTGPINATVKAQVYDSAGNPVGAEIAAKHILSGLQGFPSIATLPSGEFVLSWSEIVNPGVSRIYSQFFTEAGVKSFPDPFQVSSHNGFENEVATLASGNLVYVWSSGNGGPIMGLIFSPTPRVPFGFEFEVNTLTGAIEPHVTALAGGGFVVTYMGSNVSNLSAQVFDSNGVKVGGELLISAGVTRVDSADVAALPWGGFIVSWSGQEDGDPQTNDAGTRAQVFDSTGEKIGAEIAVNQATLNDQIQTTLAVLASGDVIVGWADASGQGGDSSGYGIKARLIVPVPTGNGGNEYFEGDGGDNSLDGGPGDDRLFGLGGADTLEGGDGNDRLDGGPGADTMRGGTGDDVYYVDDAGDVVEENPGEGTDEVRTSLAVYSLLGTNIENLAASSSGNHDFRGSTGNNVITGGGGNDFLRLQDGGADTANGGGGHDVFLFGATLTAADAVDGGAGRDQIAIQGDYSMTLGSGIVGVESIAILNGADTRFGDPGTNSYDYSLTTLDVNVAAGVQMIVDANGLRVGEDFIFNGSAETNGSFFIFGGQGVDTLTGGAGNDVFYFGEGMQWGASDIIDGRPGGVDQLGLRGSYTIIFGANQLIGIENIGLVSAQDTRFGPAGTLYNYDLTMNDGNVAAGLQLTLDAFALRGGETLTFNGSGETNGSYRVFGGQGFDKITGGHGNDILAGHAGPDWLTGGPGADQFRYYQSTDSVGATDLILDFAPGHDIIDLIRIDANTHAAGDQAFHWIGSNAFGAAGAASAGELRATFNSGNGSWLVQGDTNGDGSADLAITVYVSGPTPLGAGDFFL